MARCIDEERDAHLSQLLDLQALDLPVGERDQFLFGQEHASYLPKCTTATAVQMKKVIKTMQAAPRGLACRLVGSAARKSIALIKTLCTVSPWKCALRLLLERNRRLRESF